MYKQKLTKNRSKEENKGMIAALYGNSLFHKGGQFENDALPNEDVYVYLEVDSVENLKNELQELLKDGSRNGL